MRLLVLGRLVICRRWPCGRETSHSSTHLVRDSQRSMLDRALTSLSAGVPASHATYPPSSSKPGLVVSEANRAYNASTSGWSSLPGRQFASMISTSSGHSGASESVVSPAWRSAARWSISALMWATVAPRREGSGAAMGRCDISVPFCLAASKRRCGFGGESLLALRPNCLMGLTRHADARASVMSRARRRRPRAALCRLRPRGPHHDDAIVGSGEWS